MSDLEQQRRAYNNWGKNDYVPRSAGAPYVKVRGSYPGMMLTPEQRAVAEIADPFAEAALALLDQHKPWFTAWEVKEKPEGTVLLRLEETGVITKHKSANHDGHYYRFQPVARSFCLTSLALRDKRRRDLEARTEGSEER